MEAVLLKFAIISIKITIPWTLLWTKYVQRTGLRYKINLAAVDGVVDVLHEDNSFLFVQFSLGYVCHRKLLAPLVLLVYHAQEVQVVSGLIAAQDHLLSLPLCFT